MKGALGNLLPHLAATSASLFPLTHLTDFQLPEPICWERNPTLARNETGPTPPNRHTHTFTSPSLSSSPSCPPLSGLIHIKALEEKHSNSLLQLLILNHIPSPLPGQASLRRENGCKSRSSPLLSQEIEGSIKLSHSPSTFITGPVSLHCFLHLALSPSGWLFTVNQNQALDMMFTTNSSHLTCCALSHCDLIFVTFPHPKTVEPRGLEDFPSLFSIFEKICRPPMTERITLSAPRLPGQA